MAKFRNLIFVVLLVLLFVEVLIVFPKRLEKQAAEAEADNAAKPVATIGPVPDPDGIVLAEQKMKGIHLVESQQGKRDWELFSESAEGTQGAKSWKLKKVKVLFYTKEKVEFTVTGDEGRIDSKSKDLNIEGHVITRSENGYTFETPSIFYFAEKREIQSPQEVLMRGPKDSNGEGLILKGRKMVSYVAESRMVIKENVSAEKKTKEGKKFEITSTSAEFSGKNREARFLGNVKMNYNNMKLEGPEASFLYGSAENILSSVAIKGGVKVSDVDKFATADTVNLDLLADKYVFKGHPKVIQNNDELLGEEIVFLDGGKKVKVEKVNATVENKTGSKTDNKTDNKADNKTVDSKAAENPPK